MSESVENIAREACPFCASTKTLLVRPTCDRKSVYNPADRAYPAVRCRGCGAEVPGKDWDAKGASAVEAWNRRALEGARVRAKALEWAKPYWAASARADTQFGTYRVRLDAGGAAVWKLDGCTAFVSAPDIEAAKAAAQADFARRVQACLEGEEG